VECFFPRVAEAATLGCDAEPLLGQKTNCK
jgi:hypothetical protein